MTIFPFPSRKAYTRDGALEEYCLLRLPSHNGACLRVQLPAEQSILLVPVLPQKKAAVNRFTKKKERQ